MSVSSLKQLAIRATAWTFISHFAAQLMRFGSNLILTRLLVPEYFGLMALVHTFFSGLEMFSDIGIAPSIIQNKRGDDPDFFNTAWTLQVIRSIGLWLVSLLIAYPISVFYEEPQLLWLIPIVGFSAILSGFKSTSLFTLERHLEQDKITKFVIIGVAARNLVTIIWAMISPTIWALVGGILVSGVIDLIRSHRLIPEIKNRFLWNQTAAKELFSFGTWVFISTSITFFAMQSDRFMLGKFFPLEVLGIYSVAFALADLPRQIFGSITSNVVFPLISRFSDLPRSELRAKILHKRWLLLVGMAICISITACLGDFLILGIYDQRYKDAAWMLPILSLGIWPYLLMETSASSLLAVGKPIYIAWGNFCKFIYMVIAVPLGFTQMGILGVVIAIALNDLPIYAVVNYGVWREGLTGVVQDIQATLIMIGLIALILIVRMTMGLGLPINGIT